MIRIKFHSLILILLFPLILVAQKSNQDDIDLQKMKIEDHLAKAGFEIERGDYYNSEENLKKALKIAEDVNDKKNQGIIHTEIGKLQFLIQEPNKALVSLTKAASIQREIDDYASLALTLNIRGVVHTSIKEYQTALDYFKSSKAKLEEEDLEKYIPEVLLNEAKVYVALSDYHAAKVELDKTIILSKKYELTSIHSSALILSGKVQNQLGHTDQALSLTEEGLQIALSEKLVDNTNKAYVTLSNIYENKGDYKLTSEYLKKHIKLSDSILNIKRENLTTHDNSRFINQYSKEEIRQLKAQIDETEAGFNLTKITTILSIALITILSLLTLSLYKNNNIRLRTNNMLHKKNDELIVAKEKAELASKTKANFLSTVTHELRTPLYAVTGLTTMLLDENPKPEQVAHLKSLKFSGDYLLTFINDILQINKIEANKVELDPELFNLKNKVENVISALNNQALENNIQMHFEYEKGLSENYIADQLKVSQILINLIGNAIKFTKDGDIWVRVAKVTENGDQHMLRFEIEDNGIGITKEKQEHMFESFSQGSVQINRKYGGTGLGLSIVKGLIKILKGKIYLKSELGKGSTFFFEVPMTVSNKTSAEIAQEKPKEKAKSVNDLDLSNIKILVVEDNKINQMITKKILNKMNLYCDVVDDGETAVESVKNTKYDVVLMDIHMPGISGLEATKIIRTFNKEITMFALTAVTLEDKMPEFEEAGFDDIISKPFKQEDFETKLYLALNSEKEMLHFNRS